MNHRSYEQELLHIIGGLPENRRDQFIVRYTSQCRAPGLVFGWSVFLGSLGVDRFVLGQIFLGVLKLITVGGLGIWAIVDLFLVGGVARQKNLELARDIAASL